MKFYHRIGRRNNWLATRLLVGAGYAYGNSEVMPYSEQFYIGGANSIRAFTIRSLGPGSYRPPADDRNGYLAQTGDFKLEANIEYRFGIMGRLNGAVFLDAGNIWLLKKDPKRPGAELKWKGFLNDIALGTGFGLRYAPTSASACTPPIRTRTRRATTTFPVSRTVSDSTWPSGIRSKRPLRQGRTPAAIPAPKASGRAALRRPHPSLRSFPVRRNRGRHFPFAEIPFAIPGGMPHRCRTCAMPLRPRTAAVPDEPVPSGHLRIPFRPSGPERGGAPGLSGHSASIKCTEKRQLAAAI